MSTATITTVQQLWKNHPERRCELVRGELRMMTPAGGEHGWVIMNIAAPLATFVRKHRLGYVFGAETGFVIHRNPDSVRAPDVAFVRKDRVSDRLPEEFFPAPPDIAVEVLSPFDTASAVHEKAEQWLTSGCREVWLVDPQRKTASLCTWSDDAVVLRPIRSLTSELLPGFELQVEDLFEA